MERLNRASLRAGLMAVVVILSGCANLTAVRDFTSTSAQLTAYKEVSDAYASRGQRHLEEIPDQPQNAAIRAQARQDASEAAALRETLFKLHNVASGYMASLAQLAGEDTFDLSADIDKVSGSITAFPDKGINDKHVSAFANVAKQVVQWSLAAKQSRLVKEMVSKHGESMDTLLEGLEAVTRGFVIQAQSDQGMYSTLEQIRENAWATPTQAEGEDTKLRNRREAVLAWAHRSSSAMQKRQQESIQSAQAAMQGIGLVRAGHAEMRSNLNRLEDQQVLAFLKKTSAELRQVRTNLKQL